jgi:hypothetical protein
MTERIFPLAPLKAEGDIARAADGRPYNEAMGIGGIECDKDYDSVLLPSGVSLYANGGIVGIDAEGEAFGGYDGHLGQDNGGPLNEGQRKELAALMIERWRAFGGLE